MDNIKRRVVICPIRCLPVRNARIPSPSPRTNRPSAWNKGFHRQHFAPTAIAVAKPQRVKLVVMPAEGIGIEAGADNPIGGSSTKLFLEDY
jgi:hypothetical protein